MCLCKGGGSTDVCARTGGGIRASARTGEGIGFCARAGEALMSLRGQVVCIRACARTGKGIGVCARTGIQQNVGRKQHNTTRMNEHYFCQFSFIMHCKTKHIEINKIFFCTKTHISSCIL